ncbi:restriction endonuclease subunit S [Fusobacterium varium]|nr:restriction endonuclease subunit S [Fusobacterium varium]
MPKKKGELSIEERLEQSIVAKEEEPYKLPSNWVWTRLGDITEFIDYRGKTPTKVENGIPLITAKNIKKGYINEEPREFIKVEDYDGWMTRGIPQKGDVAITTEAPLGNVAQLNFDYKFALAQRVITLTNINFDKRFLFYSMLSTYFQLQLKEHSTGSTVEGIKSKLLKTLKIAFPPLEEQKRIVEKLDSLFEKIQKIKEIIEEVKEKTTSRREAILSKAFSGELTEKWRGENHTENARELLVKINDEKLKLWEDECKKAEDEGRKKPAKPKLKAIDEMLVGAEEEPYKLPSNWVWTRLEDICNYIQRGKSPKYVDLSPIFVISQKCVQWNGFDLTKARYTSEETKYTEERFLLPNDILWNSTGTGTVGRLCILKDDVANQKMVADSHVTVVRTSKSLLPQCIHKYLISNNVQSNLDSMTTGSTNQKELNLTSVKNLIIPLPPLEEQKEIVRVLDKVFEEENRISELISLENKIEILEKTILDRAFRGELGTGNNDDEPAIELLRRCLEGR